MNEGRPLYQKNGLYNGFYCKGSENLALTPRKIEDILYMIYLLSFWVSFTLGRKRELQEKDIALQTKVAKLFTELR